MRIWQRSLSTALALAIASAWSAALEVGWAAAAPAPQASSALAQIAGRIAEGLGPSAKQAIVFVAPLRADEPAPRGGELAGKLAALVAGALGSAHRAEPVPFSTAQTLAHREKAFVY